MHPKVFGAIVGWPTLLISFFVLFGQTVQADVIEQLSDCNDSVEETVDRAKIYFNGGANRYNLFAVNSQCYRCSKTLVSNGTINNCASLFTPHYWRLYVENVDGEGVASTDYTFGEWGQYSITSDGTSVSVKETKSPINSLEPLWILVGVLIAVIIFSFSWSYIYEYVKTTFFDIEPATTSTTYSAVPLVVNDNGDIEDSKTISSVTPAAAQTGPPKKAARLSSLDTFRGFSLALMIFVNYGYGGYWFFDHAAWNGLTFADLVFPWFMWMMGVSMALSFASLLPKQPAANAAAVSTPPPGVSWKMWKHVTRRSVTLFLLGMFIANGWEYTTWRVPGVLQYFAVSYFVTSATVLTMFPYTRDRIQSILSSESKRQSSDLAITLSSDRNSSVAAPTSYFALRSYPRVLSGYSYEWLIQGAILLVYLAIHLGGKAPGCPRGYLGPGGIAEHTNYEMCTGGIHRYIDMHAFGYKFIYHHPTCLDMYQCRAFDPEGLLGSLSACTLTYLGLMAGRVVLHFKEHPQRLSRFLTWAFCFLFLAGILCGFTQDGGAIPINKNLWSTSFVLVTAGSGLIGLSVCYVLVDVLKWWSGAPFLYLGMNSILIYVSHGILAEYMPFSYKIYHVNHATLLQCHVLGVTAWMIVAYYFHKIKFFVKI